MHRAETKIGRRKLYATTYKVHELQCTRLNGESVKPFWAIGGVGPEHSGSKTLQKLIGNLSHIDIWVGSLIVDMGDTDGRNVQTWLADRIG
jgi:hypothetical protein